jgi:endonuclease/exonuclease/phosphatase family metal-dependent hydrolase
MQFIPRVPIVVAVLALACVGGLLAGCSATPGSRPAAGAGSLIRVATFNVSMAGRDEGEWISRLAVDTDPHAMAIGAILQRVRPDVVLLNEFDHDPEGRSARRFRERYLARPLHGGQPIEYPYAYSAAVNTGEASGLDLDGDGRVAGPGDAWGFGRFPGQYGMLVLSRFPIRAASVRQFRLFPWSAMPGALRPVNADGSPFQSDAVWGAMRLSSKSHWDVPIETPGGVVHLLAAHPTPPAFDGPEDRNGRRNHDEIRLWADYLSPGRSGYLIDDAGLRGGLEEGAAFIIVGDYNADPRDGSSVAGAIAQLLAHPRVDASVAPASRGAVAASGDRHDTADFSEPTPGNLRVDYVLPSRNLRPRGSGVFWPSPGETGADWVRASDHRLVWMDLQSAD